MPATTKKPIKIVPNTIKTIPKVPLSPISKSKSFQEKLNDIQNNIDINIDDIPEDLLDIWNELQEDITPKLISKNYKLWLTIFTPFILPGIINGMSGKPSVPQPVVTVQEPAPDPKQIVNFAQKYFAEHGLELCKSLTKTDLNNIKQDLINNWGKGPDAFSKAFQDSYPVSKARLENIYRSERHLAEYNGVLERAKIADHKYKQWRAVGDERSCDLCMSHDMETVPINEPFSNGEMTATGHPQCRCSMVTYSDEDYDEMKEDSAYLDDVVNTIKLNYNCPDSEKQGTGPGSCGGSVDKESKPSSNDIWLSKIGKLPEDEPGYFYHTTTKDVLDSIKSRGLVGNQKEHNFSSNVNPNTHLTFLSASIEDKEETENNPRSVGVSYWSKMLFEKNKKDPVILRVKKENVSGVKEFGKGYEFRTKDKIDPKNLQYWSGNKWHDLSDLKKQDSAYLADAFETIKLNYKCKAGTVDDSNKCNIDEKESSATSISFKETPQQEKMRSNMESTIGQINENLESMVTEFRNDTKRYNALYKRSPESLSKALFNLPVKEKWAKMEDSFLEARKQYIDSFGGRFARTPESEQTLKLKPQQRESANKLRDVSNTILESANTVQKDSLLSFVIDSASINNSLIDGINISDNKISEIIMNDIDDESVREYIRTVFNTSDEEILKNTVGNLAKQYWEPTKDRYLKAGYKNLQSNLQDIKHMDELISSSIAPSDLVVYSGISENVIPKNLNVGDEITLKCYLSTSRLKEVASGFAKLKKGYTVAINIKPGTSALAIEDYQYNNKDMVYTMYPQISWTYADKDESHGWIVGESGKKDTGGSQREVIISRNQKYRVAKVGKNNLELETINGD